MSTRHSKKKAKIVPSLHIHSPCNGVTSVSISSLTEDGRRVKATTMIAKLSEPEPELPLNIAEIFSEDAPPIEIQTDGRGMYLTKPTCVCSKGVVAIRCLDCDGLDMECTGVLISLLQKDPKS